MSGKNKEQKTDSFFSSFGYYVVIAVLVFCLGFVYVQDHSKRKERESYRESLMKDETAEKIGSIEVVEPADSSSKPEKESDASSEEEEDSREEKASSEKD